MNIETNNIGQCDRCLNVGVLVKVPVRKAEPRGGLMKELDPPIESSFDVERICAGCLEKEREQETNAK